MQFKRIMKTSSGCARLCNANTKRKSNMDSHMLYYSKNPADGSLSLLKLKLFQKRVVGFAIPDERVDGNSLKNKKTTCSPKNISERPQFTCFVSGLKIALSKSSCFDPHEVNEKETNK